MRGAPEGQQGRRRKEAFIKSGGDKLDFRAYAEFEKKRRLTANILIVSGMLALACMYVAFLIFYMG